ncbi:hypothetical protein EDB83DRAFT_2376399, partial [Lactarius deliciosus]
KAQIDQLGQKTRALELTISRLREQLSDSRSEWQTERKEWAGECETVMACHRIAHLETNVLLSRERVALEYERDLTRKERVAVGEELEIELKEKATLLRDTEKAREAAELKAKHSQADLSALQAQLSSANTNVDRLTSRLEDAQTALAEKEQLNNEIQQEKAALKAQVGRRQSPDERGAAEVEELRKQCVTLESQIKDLESRKALQKERKNTEKLQLALDEQIVPLHRRRLTNAEEEASLLEQQSREYKDELEKALWQVKQLKADTQPDGPTSRSRVHSDLRSDEAENINPSASKIAPSHKAEVSDVKSKKTTKKPYRGKDAPTTRKPSITDNKGKRKAAPQDNEDTETIASDEKAAKSTKPNSGKNKTKTKVPPAAAEEDEETNDVAMPKKKKMRKLNITNPFASAQPHSLDWANQYNVGDGGLDIPTELSPVKVPARSLASKSASTSFWKG